MPEFSFEIEHLQDIPNTVLVIVSGAIDAKTVPSFQENMSKLRDLGTTKFVMDMEGIRYINSTGFGFLVNLADTMEPLGGGIALVRIHPKVKVVVDMLGLNDFFKIFASRKEALSFFKSQPSPMEAATSCAGEAEKARTSSSATVVLSPWDEISPAKAAPTPLPKPTVPTPAAARMPESLTPPRTVVPKPAAPATGPQPIAPEPEPAAPVRPATPATATTPAPAPQVAVACQTCKAPLAAQGTGSYACPRCLAAFSLAPDGAVSFLPRVKFQPVNMTLSPTPECIDGLYAFVGILAQKVGFPKDRVMEIQGAVKEAAKSIGEIACGGDAKLVYQVSLSIADSAISVTFSDFGNKIDPAAVAPTGKEYFGITRRTMDVFKVNHGPLGGNVVTLVKELK